MRKPFLPLLVLALLSACGPADPEPNPKPQPDAGDTQPDAGETNTPPELDLASTLTVAERGVLEVEVKASDSEGDELEFSFEDLPEFASADGATLRFAPALGAKGSYVFTVKVSDGKLEDEAQVTLEVSEFENAFDAALKINGGAAATASTEVTLRIEVDPEGGIEGELEMSLANDGPDFGAFGPFETLLEGYALSAGEDGERSVFVLLRDGAGKEALLSARIFLDTLAPELDFTLPAYANARDIEFELVASDEGSGIGSISLSNDGENFTVRSPVDGRVSWTLSATDGEKTVWVKVVDLAGHETSLEDSLVLDTLKPSLDIGYPSFVNTRTATITTSAGDLNGVVEVCIEENERKECVSEAIHFFEWTLSEGEGTKRISLSAVDPAGNRNTRSVQVTLDQTPPSASLSIATSTPGYTLSRQVTLGLNASDELSGLASVAFAEGSSFGEPLGLDETFPFELSAGEGEKSVRAKVLDKAGNESIVTASIVLDASAPVGAAVVNGGRVATSSRTVSVALDFSDAGSGLGGYCLSENAATPAADDPCWKAYAAGPHAYELSEGEGMKSVSVHVRDVLGNSAVSTHALAFDTMPPDGVSDLQARAVGSRTLELTWTSSPSSDLAYYELCVAGTSKCESVEPEKTSHRFGGLPNGLSSTIELRAVDHAGNESPAMTASGTPQFPGEFLSSKPTSANLNASIFFNGYGDYSQLVAGDGGYMARVGNVSWFSPVRVDPLFDHNIRALAHVGSVVVAVGDKGSISISEDKGQTWTLSKSNTREDLRGVAVGLKSGGGLVMVAVGMNGTIVRLERPVSCAPCANEWVKDESGTTAALHSVAVNSQGVFVAAGLLVAQGVYGVVLSSHTNEARWTQVAQLQGEPFTTVRTNTDPGAPLKDQFRLGTVMGGFFEMPADASSLTKNSAVSSALANQTIRDIWAFSPEKTLVLVQSGATRLHLVNGASVSSASSSSFPTSTYALAVRANGEHAHVVGSTGTLRLATTSSSFPIDFSGPGISGVEYDYASVAVNADGSKLYGISPQRVLYISGGGSSGSLYNGIERVRDSVFAQGASEPFAVGANENGEGSVRSYFNGGWSEVALPAGTPELYSADCVSQTTVCVAVGQGRSILWRNNNTWSRIRNSDGSEDPFVSVSIVRPNYTDKTVAISASGHVSTANSPGGQWTDRGQLSGGLIMSAVDMNADGIAVAVGNAGSVFRSTNYGESWTRVSFPQTANLTSVTHVDGGLWVSVGRLGLVFMSLDDGQSWEPLTSGTGKDLTKVVYAGGSVYVSGQGGTLLKFPLEKLR